MSSCKPPFKWAGGKTKFLPKLLPRVPSKGKTYYEPFLGAGALFWAIVEQERFERYVLSDVNYEVVCTWRSLKDDLRYVLDAIVKIPVNEETYYQVRALNPADLDQSDVAVRFLYMNRTGFNGLYRLNLSGGNNVPFGKKTHVNWPVMNWLRCSAVLNKYKVEIYRAEYQDAMSEATDQDFLFADPPYWPRKKNGFTAYNGPFSSADQTDLADAFKSCKAQRVLTNGPGARHLYDGLTIVDENEATTISREGKTRGAAQTIIVVGDAVK